MFKTGTLWTKLNKWVSKKLYGDSSGGNSGSSSDVVTNQGYDGIISSSSSGVSIGNGAAEYALQF